MMVVQLLVNAVSLGCVFALVGVGIQLVFATLGVLNFAYGAFVMFGAYLAVTAVQRLNLPLSLAMVVAAVLMVGLALLFGGGVYAPLRRRPQTALLVGMIATSVVIDNVSLQVWGSIPYRLSGFFGGRIIVADHTAIVLHHLVVIGLTGLIIAGLYLFLERTLLGKMLRATAQDRDTASMLGIPVVRLTMVTLALAGALSGVAGALIVPMLTLTLDLGTQVLIKGFAAAVIGGVGNLQAVILGGILVGFVDVFSAFYISSAWVDSIAFLLVIAVLFLRPQGLFADVAGEKV